MSIEVSYYLTGTGWADCDVRSGEERAHLSASYLSDALNDLVAAVVSLLRGNSEATAVFEEEPGRFTWRLERLSPERVRVCIYSLLTEEESQAGPDGALIFDAECDARAFGMAVKMELERLWRELGPVGYKEKWVEHDFPQQRLIELRALLG